MGSGQAVPGILGRREGGPDNDGGGLTGYAAIAKYGYGRQDPYTGRFEGYDLPSGHAASRSKEDAKGVEWSAVFGQLTLVIADFQDLGIDLTAGLHRLSWVRFEALVQGLMFADSRLARFFAPKPSGQPKTRRSY